MPIGKTKPEAKWKRWQDMKSCCSKLRSECRSLFLPSIRRLFPVKRFLHDRSCKSSWLRLNKASGTVCWLLKWNVLPAVIPLTRALFPRHLSHLIRRSSHRLRCMTQTMNLMKNILNSDCLCQDVSTIPSNADCSVAGWHLSVRASMSATGRLMDMNV